MNTHNQNMKNKLFTLLLAIFAVAGNLRAHTFGMCGSNVTWSIDGDNGEVLTISGTGAMDNYSHSSRAPWDYYRFFITRIVIKNGVTTIGDYAFYGCFALTITIPNSITIIGNHALSGSDLTSINIPNSVTNIGEYAFSYCSKLTSVTFSNNLTRIENYAFERCSSLTSISIPYGVTSIGDDAFYECSSLVSITLPNSLLSIGSWAFRDCFSLQSINIPSSVTSIGSNAFSGCSGLTSISVTSGNTLYDSRNNCNAIIATATNRLIRGCENTFIPNSVTSIGDGAFRGCSGLTSINIPNSITSIGDYAFLGCNNLPVIGNLRYADTYLVEAVDNTKSSYTIQEGTKWIGHQAFHGCSNLTSLTIPNSVTNVAKYAFSECESLNEIEFKNPVPPSFSYSCLYNTTCDIIVFCGSKNDYVKALNKNDSIDPSRVKEQGSQFEYSLSYNQASYGSVSIIQKPSCTNPTLVVNAIPNENYGFYQWSDGNTDNPRTIVLSRDTTLVAEFYDKQENYLLSLKYDSSKGYVSGGGLYSHNAYITLTAVPNDGYEFDKWSDGTSYNPNMIYLDKDMQIEAFFVPVSEDLESAHAHSFSAYTVGQTLYVDDIDAPYTVVNANGSTVYSGNESSVNLPAQGIYVVICNGDAIKVITK